MQHFVWEIKGKSSAKDMTLHKFLSSEMEDSCMYTFLSVLQLEIVTYLVLVHFNPHSGPNCRT